MNTYLGLVLLATVALVAAEDRTFNTVTSGLSQLISPGPQGPYPPVTDTHYGVPAPAEQQVYGAPPANYDNQGFTVQSGYEGFIFPTGPAKDVEHSALGTLGGVALGAKLLTHLLPFPLNKIALFFATKLGLWLLGLVLLLLIGGATTTAVCAFTPICTISFLGLGVFNRESTRALLTQDRLDQATQFVHDALDKYRELQTRLMDRTAAKRNTQKSNVSVDQEGAARGAKAVKNTPLQTNKIVETPKTNKIVETPKKNSLDED